MRLPHQLIESPPKWLLILLCLILLNFSVCRLTAEALTQSLDFKTLSIRDTLNLPTVSAQHIIPFTVPKTWQVSGAGSYLELDFQHSSELQPRRSFIEVIVNERPLFKTALTPQNIKATRVRIPLGQAHLKTENTLKVRVEQHYTDQCEDPLDPSLWTQVLNSSRLVLNYTPVLPSVDLSAYPFPMIDPLDYHPTDIGYSLPQHPTTSDLHALTLLSLNLGQWAKQHVIHSAIERQDKVSALDSKKHRILMGTPESNPEIRRFASQFRQFKIRQEKGTFQWIRQRKISKRTAALGQKPFQPIAAQTGLLFYFRNLKAPDKTVLIVTGNSSAGVLQATKYLTFRPRYAGLEGQEYLVTKNWQPDPIESQIIPAFIENETRSFKELGFDLRAVEKINAPPLTYPISVVSDFNAPFASNASMALELFYSYGAEVNPDFSSLEVRLNDRSIGNIPLTNPKGEEYAKAVLDIPNELIQPQNQLVIQFHLLPDKYGACVDHYEDHAWGKIHADSRLIVKGQPASRLPDIAILNNTGFPYSRQSNLESLHVVFPKEPRPSLLEAAMAILVRIGRTTDADTGLRATVSQGLQALPEDKDILAFVQQPRLGSKEGNVYPFRLNWPESDRDKHFQLINQQAIRLADAGDGLYIEQVVLSKPLLLSGFNGTSRILTRLTGMNDTAFNALRQFFEDDRRFETLVKSGLIKQLEPQELTLNTVPVEKKTESTPVQKTRHFWDPLLQWVLAHPVWASLLGLILLLILLRLLFRRKAS